MLPKKELREFLTITTTTTITPPEACDHSPGMPVTGFLAQMPVCKSRGEWSMTESNLCSVPLGEEPVLPKINSMLAGPWRFVLSFTAIRALQLLSVMAQLKTMLSSTKEVCPKLVPASLNVHGGTESQVGNSAVGEFMVSESSSKFSHHRNPLLTRICAILGPGSDRSDR